MTELKNDRFLRALMRQPVDRTPVWMMRQAGRYLPEYRATRAKAGDFLSLCKNTPLACEVTLQPLERYPLDAAILFSDILTIPDALGLGLYFETGEGPKFRKVIRSEADVDALPRMNAESDLDYVMNAVSTIRRELNGRVPLIGFSGSPWTLATYMIEGGSSKTFSEAKKLMYGQPEVMHRLLDHLADSVIDYLNGQIKASGRACKQVKVAGATGDTEKLIKNLSAKPREKRPQKVTALRNHIASHLSIQGNEMAIQKAVNQLVQEKFLKVSDTGVEYLA